MKKLVSRNLSKSNLFYSSLKNFPKLKLKQLLGRYHVSLLNQAAVPRQVLHIVHDDSIERTVKTRQLIVALLCTPMSCGSRRASAPWTWKCKKILIRRVVDILRVCLVHFAKTCKDVNRASEVLNEVYLQNFLHRWVVNRESNLMMLINSCLINN